MPGVTKPTKVEVNEYTLSMSCTSSKMYKLQDQSYVHDLALLDDFYVIHNR